jgi:hypothetical protein
MFKRFLTALTLVAATTTSANADDAVPRIIGVDPAPGAGGSWIVDQVGLPSVRFQFDRDVLIDDSAISIWDALGQPIDDAVLTYDDAKHVLEVTFASVVKQDRITVVLDYNITDASGTALDGEITNPDHPTFPSGNGLPGGQAVFRFHVLQGDVTRDGIVDGDDGLHLLNALGHCAGEVGYSALADLNRDGCVNALDINIYANGLGLSLPPLDDEPLLIVGILPAPNVNLDADLAEVEVFFNQSISPEQLLTGACFVLDADGNLIAPTDAVADAKRMSATFFFPPVPHCGAYTVNVSNSIASTFGVLLSAHSQFILSGLGQPPAPVLNAHDPLHNSLSITISGTIPKSDVSATSITVSGPAGTVTTTIDDGAFAVDAPLLADRTNTLYISATSACGRSRPAGNDAGHGRHPAAGHHDQPSDRRFNGHD